MRKNWNIYDTEVLNSNLCGYKDAYILVKGDIAILRLQVTQVTFKNSAPFTKCITKVFRTTVDDTEDLCIVMPMHNVIEYSSIYLETNGLWFYSKDQTTNFNVDVANNNFKSFKYKTKSLENTAIVLVLRLLLIFTRKFFFSISKWGLSRDVYGIQLRDVPGTK